VAKSGQEWLADLETPNRRRSWRFRELAAALESVDAHCVSSKGDHRTYKHGDYPDLVTLVDRGNNPLPIGYVQDVVRLLRAVLQHEAGQQ
jgi:predicted RNA binding protein YcfA (HicA-like mRNA interferase family)